MTNLPKGQARCSFCGMIQTDMKGTGIYNCDNCDQDFVYFERLKEKKVKTVQEVKPNVQNEKNNQSEK